MKVRVLLAAAAAFLSTTAMAQVDGITVGPAGAGPNDPITITIYPDQTCPTPANDPNKSLATATIIRIHSGVTVGTAAWQNVVDAGNGATDAITGFTQDPVTGWWTKTLTPNTYYPVPQGTVIAGMNFVFNGGPAGTQWDKEGKANAATTGCTDYAVAFPLSGPITEIPNSYLTGRGKMIKAVAPNPVVGSTTMKFLTSAAGKVSVKVYNAIGTEVSTVMEESLAAGEHTATWNAQVAPGIYYMTVSANGMSDSRKVVVK